jgi:adenosine deaminase
LYVTIGSDDPPMFNATLTGEYLALAEHLGFDAVRLEGLVLNAAHASLQPIAARAALVDRCRAGFAMPADT